MMKMNAPLAMMLGVVGLGAFAVYRLSKTKATNPQTTAADVINQPISGLQLKQGTHYQGRLVLQTLDVPPLASSSAQLAQFLQLLGFKEVSVYMQTSELPSSWTELRTGTPNNRWFEGTWGNPDILLPRPKQIDRLSGNGASLISGMTG